MFRFKWIAASPIWVRRSIDLFLFMIIGFFIQANVPLQAVPILHRDVLVFVPAYEASQLFDPTLNPDKESGPVCVWGNYNVFLSSKLYFALRMPNPLVSKPMLAVGPLNVYRTFVDRLTNPSSDIPAFHPYTLGSDFFIFDYDWRQEIATVSAPLLGQALDRYAKIYESKTGVPAENVRFVIVTHSMGGLVARTLLAEKPELAGRISRLYLVGSPNTGSVKAIGTLITGPDTLSQYLKGIIGTMLNLISTQVDKRVTKLVAISRPSLYELIPASDPHWTVIRANNDKVRIPSSSLLKAASWENYWPSPGLEKSLFIDGWLKEREKQGVKSIHVSDWEFCQDPHDRKLKELLASTAHWRALMGPLSKTNRLLTRLRESSRLRVIYSTGLLTSTGLVSSGSHDSSQVTYLYDPIDAGDGTVEAKRVLDDLPASSPNVFKMKNVSHGRLMNDQQFLGYFLKELSGEPTLISGSLKP